MKNLISMVDYLPDHPYSKFLKQPLELWMFVPCDEKNDPIYERHYSYFDNEQEYEDYLKEFEKAKERCLFDGHDFDIETINHHIKLGRTVEYFATFETLQLTKTAIKKITP